MKRKQKNTSYQRSGLKPSVKKHLKRLGLSHEQAYFSWCIQRSFAASLDKSNSEREAEYKVHQCEQVGRKEQNRMHHNPDLFLREACAGKLDPAKLHRPGWREVGKAIAQSSSAKKQRQQLAELLTWLNRKSKFVFGTAELGRQQFHYIQALVMLNRYRDSWIRKLEDWAPDTHNSHGQFVSLLNHLLVQYSMPEFMHTVWSRTDKPSNQYRGWYLHVAAGHNIRTAKLSVPFTKKMAHCFMQSPHYCSIEMAINWANIQALGGDPRLTEAVLSSRIGSSLKNHNFWTSVVRFFIDHPMLDRAHVGPIVDYLHAQKFEVRECVSGPGVVELIQPPQPNLSMKGRSPESLLKQVERWHGSLAKSSGAQNTFFKASGIRGFRQKTGEHKQNTWQIKELLSGAELIVEGRAMKHCVASYASACAAGRCSIWTMEYMTPQGIQKRQTIEVRNDKTVVQCRGKRNVLPTAAEFNVIQRWSAAAGLAIAPYLANWIAQ